MGSFHQIWKFINVQDIRRALANPRKAIRVFNSILRQTNAEQVNLDETASKEDRREFIMTAFDTVPNELDDYLGAFDSSDIANRINEAEAYFDEKSYSGGGMQFNGETLYLLTRLLKPDTVLEIGVANGMSTAYLLGALEHEGMDGSTDVYAIDRPLFESVVRERRGKAGLTGGLVPDKKEACWIAPRSLRSKYGYQYYVGDFTETLDDILTDIGGVDLAIYDASKDCEEMRWAYQQCLQTLTPGGVLISDDVLVNDAFQTVVENNDGLTAVVHNCGLYRKPIQ